LLTDSAVFLVAIWGTKWVLFLAAKTSSHGVLLILGSLTILLNKFIFICRCLEFPLSMYTEIFVQQNLII